MSNAIVYEYDNVNKSTIILCTTWTASPVGARRLLADIVLRPLEIASPVGK